MRKKIGEFNSVLKRIYGSLRKRYGLDYEETLEELESIFEDEEFVQLPIFLISMDDTYSRELIAEINAIGGAQAYGFYRDGEFPYKVITEVREALPQLINQSESDKFFYISVHKSSSFLVERSGVICLKIENVNGTLWLTILKNRKSRKNEIIREYRYEDRDKFLPLVNSYYYSRWERRPDLFEKKYNLNNSNDYGVILCLKNDDVVGFVIYSYSGDKEMLSIKKNLIITVLDIFVKEEYRHQGIATRMYEKVVKLAEYGKCSKIQFRVWEDDALTNLFINSLHSKKLYSLYEFDI